MKRLVVSLALTGVLSVAVHVIMDATQNRPDDPAPGSSSTLDFTVQVQDFQRGEVAAAQALWATCAATVGGTVSPQPARAGNTWQVSIRPALGEHGEKRLIGCLEDITIDRARGKVLNVERSTAAPN